MSRVTITSHADPLITPPPLDPMEIPTVSMDGPPTETLTFILSLVALPAIVAAAYAASRALLPAHAGWKVRALFVWHAFDALVHFCLEGSYLYMCFFAWAPVPRYADLLKTNYFPIPMTPQGVAFLGQPTRLYGSFYSGSLMAKLWQEYAKADRRWGGADLTVISLELLTVFVMAPLGVYVCYLLRTEQMGRAWFWMVVIATGELYGGFMTFCPEWLTGNPNLDTTNPLFLWVYLVLFNMLWVWIPGWILWEAASTISEAVALAPKRLQKGNTKKTN